MWATRGRVFPLSRVACICKASRGEWLEGGGNHPQRVTGCFLACDAPAHWCALRWLRGRAGGRAAPMMAGGECTMWWPVRSALLRYDGAAPGAAADLGAGCVL